MYDTCNVAAIYVSMSCNDNLRDVDRHLDLDYNTCYAINYKSILNAYIDVAMSYISYYISFYIDNCRNHCTMIIFV